MLRHQPLPRRRRPERVGPGSFRAIVFLVLAVLVTTSCANRAPAPGPPAAHGGGFPADIAVPRGETAHLDHLPRRIVSLSPSATETLYAVGAGKQVVAVDQYSTYPDNAPRTRLNAFNADAESVSRYRPDLVVVPDGGEKLAQALRAIGVPVLHTPAPRTLDEAYAQVDALGRAAGHARRGHDLSHDMRTSIDALVRDTPRPTKPLSYYHELDPNHYSIGPNSFLGQIYGRFGLVNIAGDSPTEYPQVSEERILQADPDLIVLADTRCCGQSPHTAARRPGWSTLHAVRAGDVVPLDDAVSSRWGPRLVDLVRQLSDAVKYAEATRAGR